MFLGSGGPEELKHSLSTREDGSKVGNQGGSSEELCTTTDRVSQPSSRMLVRSSSGGVTVNRRLNKTRIPKKGSDSDMTSVNFDPRYICSVED